VGWGEDAEADGSITGGLDFGGLKHVKMDETGIDRKLLKRAVITVDG